MKPLKDHMNLLSHVPILSPYTAPIIFPMTLAYQKPSSDPTFFSSSNPTTHQIQLPIKKISELQSIVPSLEHYDNTSYKPLHVTLYQGILVHHLHLF